MIKADRIIRIRQMERDNGNYLGKKLQLIM